jgi:hypothetical protein
MRHTRAPRQQKCDCATVLMLALLVAAGPSSTDSISLQCSKALAGCSSVRSERFKCTQCEARRAQGLHAAGCTDSDIQLYCGSRVPAAPSAPTVLWSSSATEPDQTLLLHGNGFRGKTPSHCHLFCAGSRDGIPALPNSTTNTSVAFVMPASRNGQHYQSCRVSGCSASSAPSEVFAPTGPEMWWVQGSTSSGRFNATSGIPSGPETAAPGGTLRVFGRNLGTATAQLIELEGQHRVVPLLYNSTHSSDNTATLTVPPQAPTSVTTLWQLQLKNNRTGCPFFIATETVLISSAEGFDYTAVFEVAKLGLDGALAAAAAAHWGGVVLFGKGSFQMTAPINLPANTVLRGAGMDATSLW